MKRYYQELKIMKKYLTTILLYMEKSKQLDNKAMNT